LFIQSWKHRKCDRFHHLVWQIACMLLSRVAHPWSLLNFKSIPNLKMHQLFRILFSAKSFYHTLHVLEQRGCQIIESRVCSWVFFWEDLFRSREFRTFNFIISWSFPDWEIYSRTNSAMEHILLKLLEYFSCNHTEF